MILPVLDLVNVSKSYGAVQATRELSLSVERGQIHALIGPNGAGKTTLINQIYGSETPDSGLVILNGENITGLSVPRRVRKGIGRSFQISNVLTDFTVIENAIIAEQARLDEAFRFFRPAFGDRDLIAGAMVTLEHVGLQNFSGDLVADLAHGERRLLELALALSGNPSLLLLDEPMAGAGSEETMHMTRIIEGMRSNVGILLIEHDMDAVFMLADVITVLVEGQIIATGQPEEIRANRNVLAAYLGDEG